MNSVFDEPRNALVVEAVSAIEQFHRERGLQPLTAADVAWLTLAISQGNTLCLERTGWDYDAIIVKPDPQASVMYAEVLKKSYCDGWVIPEHTVELNKRIRQTTGCALGLIKDEWL